MKILKNTLVIFSMIALFLSLVSDTLALKVTNPNYYTTQEQVPSYYVEAGPCPSSCGPLATTCWNSESIGVTNCGTACNDPDQKSQPWTKYVFSQSTCYYDPNLSIALGDTVCTPIYVRSDNTCSTGDKYNSSNPPVLNAGFCSCAVGGAYKTCCSGGAPVSANAFAVDPYDPLEGGCGNNTIVFCGGAGQPACGAAACAPLATPTPTPTPTPAPGACPTTGGWGGSCSSPGTSKPEACAFDNTCNTCSVAVCTEKEPGLYCWLNTGGCYNDPNFCKGFGSCGAGVCTPGQTRITCGTNNSCIRP